ncbi:4-aminobutyrate--2-oxoglutarate transaminase [Paenibacillus ehimensis]|uniref:(S)-3-amino-2-methylpropionate transaminase n=1 Tax=Paenibacillus ehimensis TaxID=79264 RepID=A0ABT8V8Q8_9BACL|nr:4-aminobutyrate--2-oxoglutarate transaminase [Paenibacillus ehimensis]MDO3676742.1 4-aminobutyrate--2-oxoglutarate transaminase [Paenibacillus ehimensis]MEC0211303.1 4-aminobutyrate--2-oxoglutarate transaminase [Paenibacillus ehimensis]
MKYAQVKGELPGILSRELLSNDAVAASFGSLLPSVIERAEGSLILDIDGNQFIDLAGGVGAMNVGHSHPRIVEAITEAAQKFTHTDFTVVPYASFIRLAQELCRRAPGTSPKKACFFNSGTEAVEHAIHIAKKATKKRAVICFEGAFHGRTFMSLSLTSKINPYKAGLGPFAPDVYRTPYPYVYRWPGSSTTPDQIAAEAFSLFEKLFVTQVSIDDVAAVIIEPIQGEAGFIVPPAAFLHQLNDFCKSHGMLLIADEVQTGYGRTGRFLASEYFGIEPDIITLGKSIAAGMPLSAIVGSADIMDAAGPGAIGGTFVGNPVSCAAALEVLNIYDQDNLGERALDVGKLLTDRLNGFRERYELVGDVRGVGAMVAMELVLDRETKQPADRETKEIIRRCQQKGVILFKAGIYSNVIRFLSPLNILKEQLAEALDILEEVLSAVDAEVRSRHYVAK